MYNAYKYRVYPDRQQAEMIKSIIGCCRFVYNAMLSRQQKIYKRRGEHMSLFDMHHAVVLMKEYKPWLADADSKALRLACKHLDFAYEKFFSHNGGFPRYKSRRNPVQGYETIGCIHVSDRYVKLPKVGSLRAKVNRLPKGEIKSASLTMTATGKYYVSVVVDEEIVKFAPATKAIGLDMGLTNFATDSDGNKYENPRRAKRRAKRLRLEQKSLSRKKKDSNNYKKQRLKVAATHEKIKNERNDHHQQLSTKLIRENQTVCVENLNVKGMVRNHNLAFYISDTGWSEFMRMLEYKAKRHGRDFVKIDRFHPSSQICHACGNKNPEIKDLRIRKWVCPHYGSVHDRDINAAINILNRGLEMLHP